jgi:hypothetical protein
LSASAKNFQGEAKVETIDLGSLRPGLQFKSKVPSSMIQNALNLKDLKLFRTICGEEFPPKEERRSIRRGRVPTRPVAPQSKFFSFKSFSKGACRTKHGLDIKNGADLAARPMSWSINSTLAQ